MDWSHTLDQNRCRCLLQRRKGMERLRAPLPLLYRDRERGPGTDWVFALEQIPLARPLWRVLGRVRPHVEPRSLGLLGEIVGPLAQVAGLVHRNDLRHLHLLLSPAANRCHAANVAYGAK